MADLVYEPTIYPFVDGAPLVAADLNYMFYNDTVSVDSLAIVNGGLNVDNFSNGFVVGPEHTQRGSFASGGESSGTANLDWKYTWFADYTTPVPFAYVQDLDPAYPIPGGCCAPYLKYDSWVLVLWQVYWMNASLSSFNPWSTIFLMVDGAYVAANARSVNQIGATVSTPNAYAKARSWSGHAWLNLDQGHHDIGLVLLADSGIPMTRTHAASIAWVAFRDPLGGGA
jgi:hypothetical protein